MKKNILFTWILISWAVSAMAEDGYRLWLRFDPVPQAESWQKQFQFFKNEAGSSPILQTAEKELHRGLRGMLGRFPQNQAAKQGGLVFRRNKQIPADGYKISLSQGNRILEASTDRGFLYGSYALLRAVQTQSLPATLESAPKVRWRMLNHWDNVLGTIERGYAGASMWKWYELPETIDPRYEEYARANASLGINAVVLNNVNASPRFLTAEYLAKVKALADVFRPYGIQVFLSLNFASPKVLGKLKTSDPLDPAVRQWWKDRTELIYQYIPDFGGYLVKANSEGEPGPQEYGRNHADGANMLAEAIQPFGGLVIWRAFVYAADPKGDRFREAYHEFKPLDGQFLSNVIVQVKNGPIDFMPREPFHPLFGAMPKTPLAMEFQITQEYLGFSTNLVFLPSMYKEVLTFDTYVQGPGSTVAKIIDGSVHSYQHTVMAGVANTGSDRNWTGHLMSQANWYGFGRLAWDHTLTEEQIAQEWIKQTFGTDLAVVKTIQGILLASHEVYVNFTNPLGLHHIMGEGIHFGPQPWLEKSARPDWTSIYYHRADSIGLGFDRLTTSGNGTIALYHPKVQEKWSNPDQMDLRYLNWFHHTPWNKKLSTGRTLWEELCYRYYHGVEEVEALQKSWNTLEGKIDQERFLDVKGRLAAQHREALNWRDACVLYFQTYAKQPIPSPWVPPTRTLEDMKELVRIYQLR